jgi:hypothetical protein
MKDEKFCLIIISTTNIFIPPSEVVLFSRSRTKLWTLRDDAYSVRDPTSTIFLTLRTRGGTPFCTPFCTPVFSLLAALFFLVCGRDRTTLPKLMVGGPTVCNDPEGVATGIGGGGGGAFGGIIHYRR